MDYDDPPTWTVEEHLQHGRLAIEEIAADLVHSGPESVCHHFSITDEVDPDRLLFEDGYAESVYGKLQALLNARGLEFLLDQLEAWEICIPSLDWLNQRVPMLFEIAAYNRLTYDGWTWEPRDRQPLGACTFTVINKR